jgi:hypothetical protein
MLRAERYGDVTLTHKMSGKGVWGRGLQAALAQGEQATESGYKVLFQQLLQQSGAKRKAMILVCRNCHSEKFAGDYLNGCDQVKLSSDLLVLQARAILDGLARDGLLPSPTSALIRAISTAGGAGSPALRRKSRSLPLAIERALLDMALRDSVRTWLAAYHQSPGDVLWEGFARLQRAWIGSRNWKDRCGDGVRRAQE